MDGWMVKAAGGELIDRFKTNGCAAIGWSELGDVSGLNKEQIYEKYAETYPNEKPKTMYQQVGSILRFFSIAEGDMVVTYDPDPGKRLYLIGTATSAPHYNPNPPTGFELYPNIINVSWGSSVERKKLTPKVRHKLGGLHAVFDITEAVPEIQAVIAGETPEEAVQEEEIEETDLIADAIARTDELIKDVILDLSEDELPLLVAGILRAMGYKTKLSLAGSDRAKDIIAGPDRLGLEKPRFLVEVKHRVSKVDAIAIRNFIAAIQDYHEGGLFVNTGDFTKDALYEAERARTPLTLINLDELVELIKENYDDFDMETRELLPLKKIYWPL